MDNGECAMYVKRILTRQYLEREQHDDGEPVEHVVNGGRGKGAPELVTIAHLGE